MAKIISLLSMLSAVIIGCISLVYAEVPISGYTINRDNSGYDYSNSINNGAYLSGKDLYRETGDFHTDGNSGHSVIGTGNQGSIIGNSGTTSYSGFSPSTHASGFGGYSSTTPEHLRGSSYSLNGHATSTFGGYTSNNNNAEYAFEEFATGNNHPESSFNQYTSSSTNHKNPSGIGYSDNISGGSALESYSEANSGTSSFRGFPGGSSKTPTVAGYMEDGHTAVGESSSPFNAPSNDLLLGKHKESIFTIGNSNKYMSDAYPSSSDTRYIRGNHGNSNAGGRDYGQPSMYLTTSGFAPSSPFSSIRGGSANLYTSGKINKYGKYLGDYTSNMGLHYSPRDQDTDYLVGNYNKGSGKIMVLKDGRQYSPSYSSGPPYLSKTIGSYKSKPMGFMSYPGSNVAYSSMPSLQSSFNSNSYADGHLIRGYRSSSKYPPGYGSMYAGYY